ncbi:hypothetical protein [uncultured Xylophilus sp.]|uniref:hypothetical protein n=1 Tax=uncultured Xylophilus sp. TaxID=296832 RepID=UPI0025D40FE2|nr:hypothetical protein [uncultured Xylophilus sp.]
MSKNSRFQPFRHLPYRAAVTAQLVAVLPVLSFAVWVVGRHGAMSENDAVLELQWHAEVAADAIAREAERALTSMRVLAVQERAQAGDVDAVRKMAETIVKTDATVGSVSAFNRAGHVVLHTDLAHDRPPPWRPLPMGAHAIFDHSSVWIAGMGIESALADLTVGFAVPWRMHGVTTYGLRISLKPAALGVVLREQRWPDSWTAALLDQNMVVVARSRDEEKYLGTRATPSLKALIQSGKPGVSYSRTQEGIEVATAIAPVRGTPWWVVAGLPRTELSARSNVPMGWLVVGGATTLAMSLGTSLLLMRHWSRPPRRMRERGIGRSY